MKRWLQSEEDALKQMKSKCQQYIDKHGALAARTRLWHLLLSGLIIVLSAVAGLVGFITGGVADNNSDAGGSKPAVRYSLGAVNVCTAGVTWLGGKLDLGEKAEAHRASVKSYSGLVRNIDMELSTGRRDRTTSGAMFVHICLEQMNKILEEAPELKDDTIQAKISFNDAPKSAKSP